MTLLLLSSVTDLPVEDSRHRHRLTDFLDSPLTCYEKPNVLGKFQFI